MKSLVPHFHPEGKFAILVVDLPNDGAGRMGFVLGTHPRSTGPDKETILRLVPQSDRHRRRLYFRIA
jgi:hypothetical protein